MTPNIQNSESSSVRLVFKDVCFNWPGQEKKIINNCSFSVSGNGFWMVVGKNGCGKSTLFKLIKGILEPTSGEIKSMRKISLVFQNPDHQILMPTCRSELILNLNTQLSREEINQKVLSALDEVGLSGFERRPIHTLSGGQKQRLAIASSLISGSQLLLMDEPTAMLDKYSQKKVLEIIKEVSNKNGRNFTVLWITHRSDELEYADKVASMENGRLSGWQNPINFKVN
tara:strand:+ start:1197 stop:1880 length:684 start_codon:yes stop_codon:yes gene_type:complete